MKFPIRIKTVVSRINLSNLEPMVEWATTHGASAIDFNLATRWSGVKNPPVLRGHEDDDELQRQIVHLKGIKARSSIAISYVGLLKQNSYRDAPCRQAIREFQIAPNGDVRSCRCSGILGNLRESSPLEVWWSSLAKDARVKSALCTRKIAEDKGAVSCRAGHTILGDVRKALSIRS